MVLTGFALIAFALRIYHLGSPPLLWDEGWSIGLSRLPLGEIARITALDVHPPLYYVLLKGWLVFGPHEWVTRFVSVMAGVLTVPLGYHAGRVWRNGRVGLLTALYITIAPPLIYYSQVTRMFALCVMFLVLSTCGLLPLLRYSDDAVGKSGLRKSERIQLLTFVLGAVGALYSFYYAGFVLGALVVYALIAAPRRWKATLAGFGGVVLLYLPWVLYAAPAMLHRVGERTGFTFAFSQAAELTIGGFYGLVFPYGIGWPAVYAILVVVGVGGVLGRHRLGRWGLLPVLTIGATLSGAALGAQAHMFAARYTIVASPFLALAVASALQLLLAEEERENMKPEIGQKSIFRFRGQKTGFFRRMSENLAQKAETTFHSQKPGFSGFMEKEKREKGEKERGGTESAFPFSFFSFSLSSLSGHWLFAVGVALILITTVPTITSYVYSKSYEVFEPFDPSADWRVLHDVADANDVVFFNVLSLAGTYERYRRADDPTWSYALRWDPVVEPLDVATGRVDASASSHDRLWFVLYKGTVAANADLKSWLDGRFYPAQAPGWRDDTLYLAYVDPQGPWRDVSPGAHFGNIVLDAARYTPGDSASTVVGVDLIWHAEGPVERDAKVFVHLYDEAGNLVAQHDSLPVNGTRPLTTWQVGETLIDRHGLAVPEGVAGPLQIVVGLYDPATGERLLTSDGRDRVVIGTMDR